MELNEKDVREYYEKEIQKNPSKCKLLEEFKDYDLPDLVVWVFQSFGEHLLKIDDMSIPNVRGDELPSHVGSE